MAGMADAQAVAARTTARTPRATFTATEYISNQRRFQDYAAVDDPGGLVEQARRRRRDLPALRELAEDVEEPAHRPDQVALVTTERLLDDRRPVVLAGRPPVDGGHEAPVDGGRHAELPRLLSLAHLVRDGLELLELPLELRPLAQEHPRQHRLAGARLLQQRRAHGRRLGERDVDQHALREGLGDQQLVVVTEPRDQPPLRRERPLAHGLELLEHLQHPEELLPVGAAVRLERGLPVLEPLGQALDLAPGLVTPRRRPPGAAMALDRAQRGLGTLGPLALGQLAEVEKSELVGEDPEPAMTPVARDVQRRRRPEDLLDRARLEPHDRAVGQQRVDQHAMAADGVDAEDY